MDGLIDPGGKEIRPETTAMNNVGCMFGNIITNTIRGMDKTGESPQSQAGNRNTQTLKIFFHRILWFCGQGQNLWQETLTVYVFDLIEQLQRGAAF
jgi:hypothetical protein